MIELWAKDDGRIILCRTDDNRRYTSASSELTQRVRFDERTNGALLRDFYNHPHEFMIVDGDLLRNDSIVPLNPDSPEQIERDMIRAMYGRLRDGTATDHHVQRTLAFLLRTLWDSSLS